MRPVRALVTLGSPLGIRNLIFDRLVPPPTAGGPGKPAGAGPPPVAGRGGGVDECRRRRRCGGLGETV